ncbi:Uncharacterised protein [Staphylococcus aureus]|nr:Uncharacterised protein [Staphylococcus aureus]SRD24528.1 Uncharacterised protein [Staphylococcus aureus]
MPAPTQPFASGKLVALYPSPRLDITKSPPTLPPKSLLGISSVIILVQPLKSRNSL